MPQYVVSTDMGGTFVDAVLWDLERRTFHIGKAATNPTDPPTGIVNAVAAAAERANLKLDDVLARSVLFVNGTTVTTNAMIERKGSRTGLLITAGFEDTLAIGNVISRTIGLEEAELLNYRHAERPEPVVSRELVRGVTERIDASGRILVKLDEESAVRAVDELVQNGIEALAICLLWSFKNSQHEQRLKEVITEKYPDLFVVASSDLIPIMKEYERANTTAINAYLGRVFERYAGGLRERLASENYAHEPLIMQSVGGLALAREIERKPIVTLFSGPVGGAIAGATLAKALGEPNLITTDMGGTSFDVGLILDGEPVSAAETVIERQIVAIPTVEIVTVGAGGGSIAAVDELGILRVGPQSAGAMPGPAAYNRGGTVPTVTDADVILGYIDPNHFLGGKMRISRELAEQAMQKIAKPLKIGVVEAAAAVYRIVNSRMADLIRRATVERGHDPRDFVMAAFGGCGPTHCTGYGPDIGARKIVVPPSATVFSAFGIGQSDLKHSWVQAFSGTLRDSDGSLVDCLPELNAVLKRLIERAETQLARDGVQPENARYSFSADIRYRSQVHELTVPFSGMPPFERGDICTLLGAFQEGYERRYGRGSSSPNARLEWVNLRLNVIASPRTWTSDQREREHVAISDNALIGSKSIYNIETGKLEKAPLYQAERLRPGQKIEGLALVVSYGTTIPLHAGQLLEVDANSNMIITTERKLKL
jgi:N-methylhydantoinase A